MTSSQNACLEDPDSAKGSTTWRFATTATYPGSGPREGAETQEAERTATTSRGRPRRQIGQAALRRRFAQAPGSRQIDSPVDSFSLIPLEPNDADDFAFLHPVDVRRDLDVPVRVGHRR